MKTLFIVPAFLLVAFASCKKPITEPNSGIYRGSFFKIYNNGDTAGQGVAVLALTSGGESFQLSGDSTTGAPLSCHGDYIINSSTQMTFTDYSNVYFGYDQYNLLDTTYNYTFDDHIFYLSLKIDTTLYEYNLVRN